MNEMDAGGMFVNGGNGRSSSEANSKLMLPVPEKRSRALIASNK